MRQSASYALSGRAARSTKSRSRSAPAARRDDPLRPAKGIVLGLGISSVFWSALAAIFLF